MLIRSTWQLSVTEPSALPRSHHLSLAKDLHNRLDIRMGEEQIPSTTFSGILGFYDRNGDFVTFLPDQVYTLTLSGLQESSSKAIADLSLGEALEFLGVKFEISDRQDEITTYENLYTELVANEPEAIRKFELNFLSPTAFAQGRIHLPLPIPQLMFRSWLERWNHFASVYLGSDDLIAYLTSYFTITRHHIRTGTVQIHQGQCTGFTGHVTMQAIGKVDPLLINVANLLVNYAAFSGTGIKTRLSMGYTKY
jgi:CRISPR-associated endoribonuclease Cas6